MSGAGGWLELLRLVLLGVAGLAGVVALARLGSGQVGGRSDRRAGLQLAAGLGLSVGLVILVVVAGMGSPVGGLALLPAGMAIGSVAGVATFLTAVAAYVAFAGVRPSGIALGAEIAAPAVLGLAFLLVNGWAGEARNAAANFLHVTVSVVDPGVSEDGAVSGSVELEVRVRADEGYLIGEAARGRFPHFRLHAEADSSPVPCGIEVDARSTDPARYEAGADYAYRVTFPIPSNANAECRFRVGPWWLDFILGGSRESRPGVDDPQIRQTRFEIVP